MNHYATSPDEILTECKKIVADKGWNALSMRSVAEACKISTGCLYNYFTCKDQILSATVTSIWLEIFPRREKKKGFPSILDAISWVYERMQWGESNYPGFLLNHSKAFLKVEKLEPRYRMNYTWARIKTYLAEIIEDDPLVRPDAFDDTFPIEVFVEQIFALIVSAMMLRRYDVDALHEIIRRCIY